MDVRVSVLRNGEWVTETVDIQAALKANAVAEPPSEALAKPPACGILSQTVVESPIVHWVLPVRLRSRQHNDIAFIGSNPNVNPLIATATSFLMDLTKARRCDDTTFLDLCSAHVLLRELSKVDDTRELTASQSHYVQISELQQDGQVKDILRINNLGSRILNAIVIGDFLENGSDDDGPDDLGMPHRRSAFNPSTPALDGSFRALGATPSSLPPQRLVCILNSGQLVFLFIERLPSGSLEFSISKYESPTALSYMGHHLVSDPSSRYIAAASPEGILVVFELESLSNLNGQYMRGERLRPVKSVRVRSMLAVIQKLDFLFPRLEDDFHIILVLIVVRKEGNARTTASRLIIYEWEAGDSLQQVFAAEKRGHRLPPTYQMPVLLIPIRFNTAFFAISADSIAVVKYALTGALEFDSLPLKSCPPTDFHTGGHEPLWTAWARPFRTRRYFEKTDVIYLAREDGAVIHLEIDSNEMIPSVTSGWSLQTNIDTAFTTAFDIFSDVLIIGGESGPGGIWKLAARSEPEQVNALPNWSPVVDMITIRGEPENVSESASASASPSASASFSGAGQLPTEVKPSQGRLPMTLGKRDEIFSATGRGLRGSITQWRWGAEARIGLDIELGESIRQAWALTVDSDLGKSLCALLASPTSSSLLEFRQDLGDVREVAPEKAPFDLTSRTLHVTQVSDTVTQVTEISIHVVTPTESSKCNLAEALDCAGIMAEHAFCLDNLIVLATHGQRGSQLHVLRAEGIHFSRISTWLVEGEVTCLSIFRVANDYYVCAGWINDATPWLSIYHPSGDVVAQQSLTSTQEGETVHPPTRMEAFTSMVVLSDESAGAHAFILGSRCGHLITAIADNVSGNRMRWNQGNVGVARVDVFPTRGQLGVSPKILICCEENLILMADFCYRSGKFNTRHSVWPVDLNDTSLPPPAVHSVFQIPHGLTGDANEMSLMISSGSRILLANVGNLEGHMPRTIPLAGSPTRLIYSKHLRCLVVALLVGDRPTLALIDPRTGTDISVPVDSNMTRRSFISGLGTAGDRVYGLCEWLFVKDGRTFNFIVVTTKGGNLIIITTEITTERPNGRRIRYWARYKKQFDSPIYSVASDKDGILYCVDKVVHYDILDTAAKTLRCVSNTRIESPATSLRIEGKKIFVLTTMHSLLVFDHPWSLERHSACLHADRACRRATHMIDVGVSADGPGHWPLRLTSDQSCGIVGLWIPWEEREKEFEVVFEARLPVSIRRFVSARIRPPWLSVGEGERYGTIPSSKDGAEVIGMSMCGSMLRFRLLSLDLWRALNLIQQAAWRCGFGRVFGPRGTGRSREMTGDVDAESRPDPKALHIDGDLLWRCFEERALQRLVEADGRTAALYRKYLDALEDGRHTAAIRDMGHAEQWEAYMELGYEILKFVVGRAGYS